MATEKVAIRLRLKPPKRRSPSQRLKRRLYYRKNKARILMRRRRYLRTHRTQLKHRKMFQRYKPGWFKKKDTGAPKPTHKPSVVKLVIPKMHAHAKPHLFKPKTMIKTPHHRF